MIQPTLAFHDFIRLLKNPAIPNVYDVEINHVDYLKQFNSVECHIVVYPYSRKVGSQHIRFYPFEEYVKDILSHQKSAYAKIASQFDKFFGIFLGVVIAGIFALFNIKDLLSVQSVTSVIGAYFIGKELWDDVENLLVNLTKNALVKYFNSYYSFRLEKHTTLTLYNIFAKKQRYGKTPLLPELIDFIEQSNSQTLRMFFNMAEVDARCDGEIAPVRHLFSVHIEPDALDAFEQEGFLFGVKLSLNRKRCGVMRSLELFQSLHRGERGALDDCGVWTPDAVFYRQTVTVGNWKGFLRSGLLPQNAIVGALPS